MARSENSVTENPRARAGVPFVVTVLVCVTISNISALYYDRQEVLNQKAITESQAVWMKQVQRWLENGVAGDRYTRTNHEEWEAAFCEQNRLKPADVKMTPHESSVPLPVLPIER